MRIRTATVLAALVAAFGVLPAHADPVDDAVRTVHYLLCPAPEVDLCVTTPRFDSIVCPIFAGLAPGVPGVVDIAPDGDLTVDGRLLYDCPPYRT